MDEECEKLLEKFKDEKCVEQYIMGFKDGYRDGYNNAVKQIQKNLIRNIGQQEIDPRISVWP
jgi:hypothetical protein